MRQKGKMQINLTNRQSTHADTYVLYLLSLELRHVPIFAETKEDWLFRFFWIYVHINPLNRMSLNKIINKLWYEIIQTHDHLL
jgi:hypothetical protein